MNTALADQLDAASRDAERRIRAAAARIPAAIISARVPEGWLARHIVAHSQALTDGQGALCPHIGPNPRVVHAAVWRPGWLVCPDCLPLLTPTPEEDTTCDRCQRYSRRLTPFVIALGPVLLGYGLCRRCITPDAAARGTPPAPGRATTPHPSARKGTPR